MENAILSAFFKVKKSDLTRGLGDLRLALAWNQFEMAKEYILDAKDVEITKEELSTLFPYSLVYNRVDFLREFINKGVKPTKFLSDADMLFLYNSLIF